MAAIEPGTEPAGGEATGTVETPPDFKSVREAQAWQREHGGDPGVIVTPDEPIFPVTEPTGTEDDFSDLVTPEPDATTPVTTAPAATTVDPFADFGGRQSVEDAIVVANALKTEQGVRAVVAQGLQALGYTPDQVTAFLASKEGQAAVAAGTAPTAPTAVDPFADVADDDVLDGATVKQMLGSVLSQITERIEQAQATAAAPALEAIQQDRQIAARAVVDNTLVEVLGIDPVAGPTPVQLSEVADVQAFANKYIEPGNWDPNHIANAIRRGHADMAARDEARAQAYIARKRAARQTAPANIGGGQPSGGEAVEEPKSAADAARIRKALGLF